MSEAYPFATDLYGNPIEHSHLLSSDRAGWESLNLIYELEPAGEMPAGITPYHALVITLGDCRGKYKLDGKWHREDYRAGDLVIFPAGELFPRFGIDRETPLLELFIPPTTLIDSAGETVSTNIKLESHYKLRDPLIQQMGLALKAELERGGADSKIYADSMATALSIHLLRRYATRQPDIREYNEGLPTSKLNRAIAYIEANLDGDLTLSTLARLFHMSPHYFATLFKKSLGIAPHQYVIKCRLERAKILLKKSDLPILEICDRVGFKNQSHFTRLFRQRFQITPKTYRNS